MRPAFQDQRWVPYSRTDMQYHHELAPVISATTKGTQTVRRTKRAPLMAFREMTGCWTKLRTLTFQRLSPSQHRPTHVHRTHVDRPAPPRHAVRHAVLHLHLLGGVGGLHGPPGGSGLGLELLHPDTGLVQAEQVANELAEVDAPITYMNVK